MIQINRRHLSIASDIALLLVAALICVVLARDFLLPRRAVPFASGGRAAEPIKSPIRLSGVDFSRSDRTLLFVLSTQCGYCRASEPFYRELISRDYKNVQMAAALSQPLPEAQAYLQHAGLPFPQIASADLEAMGVAATPTLILADKKGNVLRYWRGKLPSEGERRVTDAIQEQP